MSDTVQSSDSFPVLFQKKSFSQIFTETRCFLGFGPLFEMVRHAKYPEIQVMLLNTPLRRTNMHTQLGLLLPFFQKLPYRPCCAPGPGLKNPPQAGKSVQSFALHTTFLPNVRLDGLTSPRMQIFRPHQTSSNRISSTESQHPPAEFSGS